jgi:dUTP pyrophosphatase
MEKTLDQVRIKRLRDVELPKYQTVGAAGFDLAAGVGLVVGAQGKALIPTGLVIESPPDHALLITPRSSLFYKKSLLLANAPGVIDEDYCGDEDEILLSVFNPTNESVHVSPGERLAQGLFVPVSRVQFKGVEQMGGQSRGGFGSTGL